MEKILSLKSIEKYYGNKEYVDYSEELIDIKIKSVETSEMLDEIQGMKDKLRRPMMLLISARKRK